MAQFWNLLPDEFVGQLQAGYIGLCGIILLALLIWRRKSVPEIAVEPTPAQHGRLFRRHDDPKPQTAPHSPQPATRFWTQTETPGFGTLLHLLILISIALAGLIGWRIPAEIERIYGDGASFNLIFPNVTLSSLGKAAQVIGGITFALLALRILRYLVPLIGIALLIGLGLWAIEYVFDLSLKSTVQTVLFDR